MSQGYLILSALGLAILFAAGSCFGLLSIRRKGLGLWTLTYVRERSKRRRRRGGEPVHMLLCIADHFEPWNGRATPEVARQRMLRWVEEYPRLCRDHRDSDGLQPRHTFFYPIEQYHEEEVAALAGLCRLGLGEVEVHLHHDGDTPDNLRHTLLASKELLARRHGLLARHRVSGATAYGFVHGVWALDNARSDGLCCGVNNEIEILRTTGCYADFTLPCAPDSAQTRKINSIYYAVDDPYRPKSHDWGLDVGSAPAPSDGLMIIQGPLILSWRRRKWAFLPRIENGCIQGNQPAAVDRLDDWLRACVHVSQRPDWYFIKLHTHGGPEANQQVLLGEPMAAFHRALAQRASDDPSFQYHYVTAREMYNLARAAEAGWQGTVSEARDYELVFNGATGTAFAFDRDPDCWATTPSARSSAE
jgi:hypothetical protein